MGGKITAVRVSFIMLSQFFFAKDVTQYLGSIWHSAIMKTAEKIISFATVFIIYLGILSVNFYIQAFYVKPVEESAQWPLLDPTGEFKDFALEFYGKKWRNFTRYWMTFIIVTLLAPCFKWLYNQYKTNGFEKSDDSYASKVEEDSEKVLDK